MIPLAKIGREYPRVAAIVGGFSWLADGLDQVDYWAIVKLEPIIWYVGRGDPQLVEQFVRAAWVADGIDGNEEIRALELIAAASKHDPFLAGRILELPWVADGINSDDRKGIVVIVGISVRDMTLAHRVLDLAWVADGLTNGETRTLEEIPRMAWPSETEEEGRRLARILIPSSEAPSPKSMPPCDNSQGASAPELDFAWRKDGLTLDEEWALRKLVALQCRNPSIYKVVAGFPWVADNIAMHEQVFIGDMAAIAVVDSSLARRLAGFDWVADGLDFDEHVGVHEVRNLATKVQGGDVEAPSLAWPVVGLPWFSDGITRGEQHATRFIASMKYSGHLTLARRLLESPWFQSGNAADRKSTVSTLWRFTDLDRLVQVTNQPWFLDGVTEEEHLLIEALSEEGLAEDRFQTLLTSRETGKYLLTETLTLPGVGEVRLSAVSAIPFREDTRVLEAMVTGTEILAEFMAPDAPWPKTRVVLNLEPEEANPFEFRAGLNDGSQIQLLVPETYPALRKLVYHELAHFYFGGVEVGGTEMPLWLIEGAAEFLGGYVLHETENVWQPVLGPCRKSNIHQFNQAIGGAQASTDQVKALGLGGCLYSLGNWLLMAMYEDLGHEAVASSLKELYLTTGQKYSPGPGGSVWTEEEIYQVFLSNTPPEKKDVFRELYSRLHGGPVPGS